MDLSTRKLRYFVVLAEELHFSRAASRLFIAQQALSKQIRELEQEIGAKLLNRTTRKVTLTPAGEAFLTAATSVLAALDDGVEAALGAARGESGTLTLGFMVGAALELTAPILTEFGIRYPDVELELQEFPFGDTSAGLANGWADVALTRLPFGVADVEYEPLFVEPIVFAVRREHPLARRSSVSVRELLDEPIVVGRTGDEAWRSYWCLDAYRDGRPPAVVTQSSSHTEELELIAAGVASMPTAAAAARYTQHPGVRYIPIDDIPGTTLTIAWRRGHRTPLVDAFVAVAREVRDREHELLDAIEHPFRPVSGSSVSGQAG